MKHVYILLPLALMLFGCEAKDEEDHSILDEMVLLEKEEEDVPLVIDPSNAAVAKEQIPAPQEVFVEEDQKR